MSEIATNVIDFNAFKNRQENGLYVPLHEGGIELVDCGDDRRPTTPYREQRGDIIPARFFGGPTGKAVVALTALVMAHGEGPVKRILRDYGVDAFVDLAGDIAHGSHDELGIAVHQHSADVVEGNPEHLAPSSETTGLGCKFNAALGGVMLLGSCPETLGAQLDTIHHKTGTFADRRNTQLAQESLGVVLQLLGGQDVSVERSHIARVMAREGRVAPFVMLEGHHAPSDKTSVVLDLAGFKSRPSLEDPTYHHTPALANLVLPRVLPEFNFDESAVSAAGLVIGVATQRGLGVERMDIIPSEWAAA